MTSPSWNPNSNLVSARMSPDFSALSQSTAQRRSVDRSAALVVLPARPRDVAAYHALKRDRLGHNDPHAPLLEVRQLTEERGWDRQVRGKVIADQVGRLREPGKRELIQDPSLLWDRGWEHHVE